MTLPWWIVAYSTGYKLGLVKLLETIICDDILKHETGNDAVDFLILTSENTV